MKKTLLICAMMACSAGVQAETKGTFVEPTPQQLSVLQKLDNNQNAKYMVWNHDLNDDGIKDMIVKTNICEYNNGKNYVVMGTPNGYLNKAYTLPDWRNNVYVLKNKTNGMRQLSFDDRQMNFSYSQDANGNGGWYVVSSERVAPTVVTLTAEQKNQIINTVGDMFGYSKKDKEYALANMSKTADAYDFNLNGSNEILMLPQPLTCPTCGTGVPSLKDYMILQKTKNGYRVLRTYAAPGSTVVLKTRHNGWYDLYVPNSTDTLQMTKDGAYKCSGPCRPCYVN